MDNKNELLKNEILLLIMDFLYSNDLMDSLMTIEKETKKSIFSYNKELSFLRKLIIEGNWEEAENFLLPLKSNSLFDHSSAIYSIKLQKFFEIIETESLNYNQNDIELLLKDIRDYSNEEEFKELLNILNKNSIREEPKYENWSINRGRLKTFEKIRKLLEVVYPIDKEKEKSIKDNLLFEFFSKIIVKENEKVQKNKLINEIISIINGKNISNATHLTTNSNNNQNKFNNFTERNNKNDENIKKSKKNQNKEQQNDLTKKSNKERQKNEKIRPQSGIRLMQVVLKLIKNKII